MFTALRPSRQAFTAALTAGAVCACLSGCATFEHATKWAVGSLSTHSTSAAVPGISASPSPTRSSTAEVPDAPTLVHDAQEVLRRTTRLTYSQDLMDKDGAYSVTTRGSLVGAPMDETTSDPKNGTSTYRLVGTTLYLKADATYYAGDTYALQHFVGRWVHIPAGKHADTIIREMTIKPLIDDILDTSGFMRAYLGSGAAVTRDTLPGAVAAYRVHGSDGSNLWISADGKNHVLKLSGYTFSDGTTGTDRLSGYDDAYADITAPAHPVQMPNDYEFDDDSSAGSSSERGQTT